MNPVRRLREWWRAKRASDAVPGEGDAPAWLVSLVVHLGLLILLTIAIQEFPRQGEVVELSAVPLQEDFEKPEDFFYSDQDVKEIGANSIGGKGMADSLSDTGQDFAKLDVSGQELTQVAEPSFAAPELDSGIGQIVVADSVLSSTGTDIGQGITPKGAAGYGVTGASGAVDRITQEILDSMQKRKTLVVWLFDQSISLSGQREGIRMRLDRIYEELGVVEASQHPAFAKHHDKPLLTSVMAFGKDIHVLTSHPTDQVAEIKSAIEGVKNDDSGVEKTFAAVNRAAEDFKSYASGNSPRNLLFIVFTDESGDDGVEMLDKAVTGCRRVGARCFVVGIPAPFGRKEVEVKWVDPDPKFNQDPQWVNVDQGPETLLPERVKIGFTGDQHHEEPMDSGFGPFALTRLAVATGGIYFTVHPNRHTDRPVSRSETSHLSAYIKFFFDPEVMRKYRPDYVSAAEYQRKVRANRAKRALVETASSSWVSPISNPQLRFRRRDEADLARQLSTAQQQAAKLEPKVQALYNGLIPGKNDREKITEPRWEAGYDLAMGQVLALKVRTEGYNIMLAKAKRGMKFQNPKDDTWDLRPSKEINAGSLAEKEAKLANFYLQRVVDQHPGTPWAKIAQDELNVPLGWEWRETFTNVNPPRVAQPNNNNNNPKPRDDQRNMIPPKPTRSPPKI